MKTQEQPSQRPNQVQGLVSEGRIILSQDGRYVTIYFADGSKLREHRNRYLAVLGAAFTREAQKPLGEAPETMTTGFIAKTRMALSKDQNYLTVFFPGGRFRKHVNYYKSVLNLAYLLGIY